MEQSNRHKATSSAGTYRHARCEQKAAANHARQWLETQTRLSAKEVRQCVCACVSVKSIPYKDIIPIIPNTNKTFTPRLQTAGPRYSLSRRELQTAYLITNKNVKPILTHWGSKCSVTCQSASPFWIIYTPKCCVYRIHFMLSYLNKRTLV